MKNSGCFRSCYFRTEDLYGLNSGLTAKLATETCKRAARFAFLFLET